MIEALGKNDLKDILHLQPEDWTDILQPFHFYVQNSFCFPIKCVLKNKIVGLGCGISNGKTAWIAHIIVDKGMRGTGIGKQITQFLVQILKEKECETILLLATALGEIIYRKLGFIEESSYIFMRSETSRPILSKDSIPYDRFYKNQILALDQKISGETRDHLILPHLKDSQMYLSKGKVNGIFLPSLGEGLIFADSNTGGIELLKYKISKKATKIVLPIQNEKGVSLLKDYGYIEYSRCIRMSLGRKIKWQPEGIFSRIGGNLG